MSYIFIGNGSPESRDYDSSYLFYDEDSIESMEFALDIIERTKTIDPKSALLAQRTIKKSLERKRSKRK